VAGSDGDPDEIYLAPNELNLKTLQEKVAKVLGLPLTRIGAIKKFYKSTLEWINIKTSANVEQLVLENPTPKLEVHLL
jgi:hypothetical protein